MLTRGQLRDEPRQNLEQCAEALGFAPGFERWPDRKLVRRIWRVMNPAAKRVVKLWHLRAAKRIDLDRLASWMGVERPHVFDDRQIVEVLWPLVDARARVAKPSPG